jgi:protein SCO1/2
MQQLSNRKLIVIGFAVLVLSVSSGIALWNWQANLQRQGGGEDRPLEGLQIFGAVPEFSFIERDGRRITLAELKGKVWLVNFIYTNCPDTCPVQSAQMREIQEDFKKEKDLRLVSITVDPTRDTTEVLSEYAKRFSADSTRWLFLTGKKDTIYKFAQEGFHLGAVELPHEKRPESGATHTHSPRFVLVDGEAQIRGYYVSTDAEAMKRLGRDLKILLPGQE